MVVLSINNLLKNMSKKKSKLPLKKRVRGAIKKLKRRVKAAK